MTDAAHLPRTSPGADLREVAAALERSEVRRELALEVAGLGTLFLDLATGEDRWDERPCGILGVPTDADFGPALLASLLHPDDRERARAHFARALDPRTAAADGRFEVAARIARPVDGVERHVVLHGQVFFRDAPPTAWRVVATVQDRTDRVREEVMLRANEALARERLLALEATYADAPIGLCVFDTSLRWVRINDWLARLNGILPEKHIGHTVRELLPQLADVVEPLLRRVIDTGEPVRDFELSGETPADPGVVRHWIEHFHPLRHEDGTVVGVNVVCLEVTDRRRAEQEHYRLAEAMQRELEERVRAESALLEAEQRAHRAAVEANVQKSRFLANMSHELRTPLNAIAGHVELVALGIHGPVTPEQVEALDRVRRAERHLLSLIDDLLSFARIEAGRVEYRFHALDLRETMAEAASMVETQMRTRGLVFEVALPPAGTLVHADPDKLRQILLNLLSNASKFTPRGGRVALDTCAGELPGSRLVRVVDNGIGIAPAQLDEIFDPFVQVSFGLTRHHEGTGLGLAISRELARGMGGDVLVSSVADGAGRGSTFAVLLYEAAGRAHDAPGARD
jgi:PAS domain S-box-containing protein